MAVSEGGCFSAKHVHSSLGPRLSSSFSSLALRIASDEKLDESLGPRLG